MTNWIANRGGRARWACALPLILILAACGAAPEGQPADTAAPATEPAATEPAPAAATDAAKETSQTAPEITVVSPEALAARLDSLQGKTVVVNYWATWCMPCIHEMPELVKFYNTLEEESTAFVSISVDHPDTVEDAVKPFMAERELPFPVLVANAMPDELRKAVDLADWTGNVPATFLYGPDGSLQKHWFGEVTFDMLSEAVTGGTAE